MWLTAVLAIIAVYVSVGQCAELHFAPGDSVAEISDILIKKTVFLNCNEVEERLPVLVRRDIEAGLRVLCTQVDCIPVFAIDPAEFQLRDSVDFISAGWIALALGYKLETKKKQLMLSCVNECPSHRVGAQVGAFAPGFRLSGSNSEQVSLTELRKRGPVVVAFVRSLEWDPFSQRLARGLQSNLDSLRAAGCSVIAIHGYGAEQSSAWRDSLRLTYPLLPDNASAVMRGYEVFDRGRLPHPAAFVVDTAGVIHLRDVFDEMAGPPDLAPIFETISRLP